MTTTITSREFNQHASEAKKATRNGPVFITDRGRPAHVLLSIDDYYRLTGDRMNLIDALAQPDSSDIEFEPPKLRDISRPVDLS